MRRLLLVDLCLVCTSGCWLCMALGSYGNERHDLEPAGPIIVQGPPRRGLEQESETGWQGVEINAGPRNGP